MEMFDVVFVGRILAAPYHHILVRNLKSPLPESARMIIGPMRAWSPVMNVLFIFIVLAVAVALVVFLKMKKPPASDSPGLEKNEVFMTPEGDGINDVRNLINEGKLGAAKTILLEMLSSGRETAEVHNLLGNISAATLAFSDAHRSYETALSIIPGYAEALNNIGNLCNHSGRIDDAIKYYQRALELKPELNLVHSNMLMSMNYSLLISRDELFAASREWFLQQCRDVAPALFETLPIPGKKLTVGYVSNDFRYHPVGFLFQKVVQNHTRQSFRVICYSTNPYVDSITNELRRLAEWRDVSRFDDDALVAAIIDDRIDILVDLAGHTAGNRLKVFARRPAPVQVSWIGYYNTTGIPQIDYHITITVAAGEERWFTEEVIRLTGSRFCYSPPVYAPEVTELPFLKTGSITFGSFNNLAKLNKEVVLAWARLLDAVPNSRLILKWHSLREETVCKEYAALFSAHGVQKDRLEFRAGSNHADMLKEYGDIELLHLIHSLFLAA